MTECHSLFRFEFFACQDFDCQTTLTILQYFFQLAINRMFYFIFASCKNLTGLSLQRANGKHSLFFC